MNVTRFDTYLPTVWNYLAHAGAGVSQVSQVSRLLVACFAGVCEATRDKPKSARLIHLLPKKKNTAASKIEPFCVLLAESLRATGPRYRLLTVGKLMAANMFHDNGTIW